MVINLLFFQIWLVFNFLPLLKHEYYQEQAKICTSSRFRAYTRIQAYGCLHHSGICTSTSEIQSSHVFLIFLRFLFRWSVFASIPTCLQRAYCAGGITQGAASHCASLSLEGVLLVGRQSSQNAAADISWQLTERYLEINSQLATQVISGSATTG